MRQNNDAIRSSATNLKFSGKNTTVLSYGEMQRLKEDAMIRSSVDSINLLKQKEVRFPPLPAMHLPFPVEARAQSEVHGAYEALANVHAYDEEE